MKPRTIPLLPHRKKAGISATFRDLARFRYHLRIFLRFSENAARKSGVTPQQHQLMLGIAGYPGTDHVTISALAEFLQERHNSVVGLVERAVRRGLVRKANDTRDRRVVFVSLTARGKAILAELSELHREEIQRLKAGLFIAGFGAKRASKK